MNYKKISILFLIISFVLTTNFAYAFEIKYPDLPGGVFITEGSSFPAFVKYFFTLGIGIAGIFAVISLAIAGIQIMITSNPSLRSEAGERVKGAVLGLVLLFASVLIMRTINPKLETLTQTPLPIGAGVFYVKGSDLQEANSIEVDATVKTAEGYNELEYRCKTGGGGTGPRLWVWKFKDKNLKNYQTAVTEVGDCDHRFDLTDFKSFKFSRERPGVYYFLGPGCLDSGSYSSDVVESSGPVLDELKGKVQSIYIVNEPSTLTYFGVIFHENSDYTKGGSCVGPYLTSETKKCLEINPYATRTASADVFVFNKNSGAAGDKIIFNSEPFGQDTASIEKGKGYYIVKSADFGTGLTLVKKPELMNFSYTDNTTDDYKQNFKTFKDKQGSMEINGHYLVAFVSDSYCQTFTKNVPNFGAEEITPESTPLLLNKIDIFSIR